MRQNFLNEHSERRVNVKLGSFFFAMAAFVHGVSGCSNGTPADTLMRVCLTRAADATQFVSTLRQIAADEHMQFVDGSASTKRDLQVTGGTTLRPDGLVINAGIFGADGLSAGTSELPFPGYQVGLAINFGANSDAGARFARLVRARLSKQWKVESVPRGQGVTPTPSCAAMSG